jgi:hypothetical protein
MGVRMQTVTTNTKDHGHEISKPRNNANKTARANA